VVDSKLETPLDARILQGGPVLIAAAVDDGKNRKFAARGRRRSAGAAQCRRQGRSARLLEELARRGINEVHAEAGFKLNGSLLREGLVDELLLYLAPCLIGHAASGLFNLPELTTLDGKRRLQIRDLRQVGADIRLIARLPLGPQTAQPASFLKRTLRHSIVQRVEQQQAPDQRLADAGCQFQRLGRLHGADDAGQRRENPHHRAAHFLDIVAFRKQAVVAR
jgi:hypothetical protein